MDAIGDAIHVEAFRQYTVEDLEEEMEVSLPPSSFTRPNTPQYQPEDLQTLPYPAGMNTLLPRTILAKRDTRHTLSKTTLGNGALLCHPALATPPALPRASPMLVPLLSSPSHGSSYVREISFRGPHIASPLTGGGDTAPHHGTSFGTTSTQPPPIRTIDDWIRALHTHTHEGFTALLESHTYESCTPC